MNRVKVVATIGPRTETAEAMIALHSAGMDVARLNGSRAGPGCHGRTIELLRQVLPDVPILFDLPGRKFRIVGLQRELAASPGDRVLLAADSGVHTSVSSYRLCPLEKVFRKTSATGEWEEIPLVIFAPEVKAGFMEEVAATLSQDIHKIVPLVALRDAIVLSRY